MLISLIFLFGVCMALSFYEEKFIKKDKVIIFALLGILMLFIAGLREVGVTPDSATYEDMYYGSGKGIMAKMVEPSFTLISNVLLSLQLGVNALFFVYAFISVPIRLTAIWKLSNLPLLTLSIYISYYYLLHDVVQIRCAVASALFLLALYYRLEHKNAYALLCILGGWVFHFSAIVGLVIFLLDDKPLKGWQSVLFYAIIPLGMIFSISAFDITQFIPESLGGNKLQLYRELKDKGLEDELEGLPFYRDPAILLNIALFYGCLFFQRALTEVNKYVPMFLKIMAIAFLCKFTLGNLSSVLASRLFEYFDVVSIFLWTSAIFAFYPKIVGVAIVNIASSVRFILSDVIYLLIKSFW